MATKKENETAPVNSNVNNNTNNINLNVKVEHPKVPRKPKVVEKKKPNWVVKAVVLGIIGLSISLLGLYLSGQFDSGGSKEPVMIENGAAPINRDTK